MQIPAVDWTGQDVNFAGTPKWYAQVKEALIRRLEALSHQIQHPYGLSPEALEGVRRQKAALEAQAQKLDKPYAIPLSITGTSEKVLFTPAELERARNDEVLARKIFESATGIPNPPRADVDEFRQRIIYQYPQLNELVDQQHQFETQQRQERQNFAQQEQDINKYYPLNEYDALENLRDARPPVRSQMHYADQTNNQNDPLQQLAALQAQSLQPGGAYAGQPQQQPQVQQQATGSAPALSVDQIMANTGVKRSIAENIYNQVANKPGAVLGASDNLINTGSLSTAQVKNLENLFRQPNSAPLHSEAVYAGQQQPGLPNLDTRGMNDAQRLRVSRYLDDLVKYQANPNTYPLPNLDTSGMNDAQRQRVSNFQKSLQMQSEAAYAGAPQQIPVVTSARPFQMPSFDTTGMGSGDKVRFKNYLNDLAAYQANPTNSMPSFDTTGMGSGDKARLQKFQTEFKNAFEAANNLTPQQQPGAPRGAFNKLMHGAVQILRDKGHLPPRPGAPAPTAANPIDTAANLMEQQQVLPDMNPYANADNGYMLHEENLSPEESLLNRASIPLKKAKLGEQHGRVAPMNPLHEQAQRMMQRNIDSDEGAFEHAQSQLEEAQRLNLPKEIRGHLQSGLTPTYQLSDPYMNKYNKDVIDALRQEAQTNFLEDIMPHVKGQYAATGAYHSGARQNELNRFAQKTQQQLNRDIAKLLHQGHEGAMNRAGEQNERQMQAAQIAGNAAKAQQEAHVRNAEARRNLGLIQKESKKHDIAAVSQFATQHQQQLQNEMNAKQLAYLESKMEPHVRLGRYADTVAGIPSTSSMQVNANRGPAPNPPSPYNVVPGLLGQVFGLQNQPAPFKKGGSVNNKYATPEGLVNTAVNEYKQFADSVQPQKYDQEIEDLTTGFRNHRIDPIQNWVQHVSAQMLANNREDPLTNVGKGAIVAEENMMKHRDTMLASREKAANLYAAMNQSRQHQQQLIGDYTQKYAANSESRRHNSAMETLKKEENEIKRLKNSLGASPKAILDMEYKQAQLDELKNKHQETKTEALSRMTNNLNVIDGMKELVDLIKEKGGGTIIGPMKQFFKSNDADIIETASKKIAIDLQKGVEGLPRAQKTVDMIKESKPGISHSLDTNKNIASRWIKEAVEVLQDDINLLLRNGETTENIEQQKGIKVNKKGQIILDKEGLPIRTERFEKPEEDEQNQNIGHQDITSLSNEELERIAAQ